jgi:hypothetical protein
LRGVFGCVPVFDLSVEGCHNFFVNVDGDVDVLVHNQPDIPILNPDDPDPYSVYYNTTEGDCGGSIPGYKFYAFSYSLDAQSYEFSWGNGETTLVNDPVIDEGDKPFAEYDWDGVGIYEIKVRANDNFPPVVGGWSEWSDPLYIYVKENFRKPENHTSVQYIDNPSDEGGNPHEYIFSAQEDIKGAVCIDLFNEYISGDSCYPSSPHPARGLVPFGRIWLFDLGSIVHYMPQLGTLSCTNILENDAVITNSESSSTLELGPISRENEETFDLNVILIRGKTNKLYGTGEGIYEFAFQVENTYVREPINYTSKTHDIKLQFFGEYSDAWMSYYVSTGFFYKLTSPPNTIRIKDTDKLIVLTSSMIRVSLEGIK